MRAPRTWGGCWPTISTTSTSKMAGQADKGRDTNYAASIYQLAAGLQGVDTYEATARAWPR